MYDAVDMAELFLERDMCVTCIPVVNDELEEDVAVVALEPNPYARLALEHDSDQLRVRALLSVAIHSHGLLPSRGLSFRCPSSS
jgi:hypothetical protein